VEIKSNFEPYKKQAEILENVISSESMHHVLVSSRQCGKTLMALNLLLYYAINHHDSYNVLVSPVFSQSKKSFMDLQKAAGYNNPLVVSANQSELIMQFWNGSVIRMLSAESRQNLRGFTVSGILVIDEAAYIDEIVWTEILKPTTLIRGKKVIFVSTPNGFNWFHKLFNWGEDDAYEDWNSYRITSYDNPYLDQNILDLAKLTIPEKSFQQEYLGVFVEGGGSLFDFQHCATLPGLQPGPQPNKQYYAGLDLAIANDFTVLTIIDQDGNLVDFYRTNGGTWEVIIVKVTEKIKKWRCKTLVEKNSIGSVVYEQLNKACPGLVTPFNTTQDSKIDIIEALKLSFSTWQIHLPVKEIVPDLHSELNLFTYKLLPSGKINYSAPGGYHDDCIVSLALANWHLRKSAKKGQYAVMSGANPMVKFNEKYQGSSNLDSEFVRYQG